MTPTGFEPVKNPDSEDPTGVGIHIGIHGNDAVEEQEVPSVTDLIGQRTRDLASGKHYTTSDTPIGTKYGPKRRRVTNEELRRRNNARHQAARDTELAEQALAKKRKDCKVDDIAAVWDKLTDKDRYALVTLAEQMSRTAELPHKTKLPEITPGKGRLIPAANVAADLGITIDRLRAWTKRGWIKATKVGGRVHYTPAAVKKAAATHLKRPRRPRKNK